MSDRAAELDQWYTSEELANRVIGEFYRLKNSSKCKYTIEPSAGTGILLDLIKGTKAGFDLEPKKFGIKEQNFLTSSPEILGINNTNKNNVCFVGNPPFSIGKEFFNHAASMKPQLIAMILPLRFKNPRFQNELDRNYNLIYSSDIDCCYVYKGSLKKLKTVFQVWELNTQQRELWENPEYQCATFDFVRKLDEKTELLLGLRQINPKEEGYLFIPSSIYGRLDKIATTDIRVLQERILKIYNKPGNKKTINEISKSVAKSFNFLKTNSNNGRSPYINAKSLAGLFNSVDVDLFQMYETCSGQRCGISQRNILDFYQSTFDPKVKCIYKTSETRRPF